MIDVKATLWRIALGKTAAHLPRRDAERIAQAAADAAYDAMIAVIEHHERRHEANAHLVS